MNRTNRRPSPRALWLTAAGVFAAALALYSATLAPTVTLVDSGELIVAARTLGVAHPPGFPLYVLLAHLMTLLPFGSVAVRVNFASALFAALAGAVLTLVAAEVLCGCERPPPGDAHARKPRPGAVAPLPSDSHTVAGVLTAAMIAGLLLVCSRTLWAYATIAEVYTLNTFLLLLVFLLMLRWRRAVLDKPLAARPSDVWLRAAALVFGLALGVHHVTVGLTLPALAVLVLTTAGGGFFRSRRLAWAALWAFVGLSVYAYLPLAAWRSPPLNWGDPRTLQRLWWHVGGRQYLVSLSFSLAGMANQARTFARLVGREFGPPWLPVGLALSIAGLVVLSRRDRTLFWFLLAIAVCNLAYAFNYDIAEDKDAYYLPVFVAAAIGAGVGAYALLELVVTRRRGVYVPSVATGTLLLIPVVALAGNLPFNNRHNDFVAADYVDNILRTIEPHGLLLTLDWQVCSPLLYTRLIQHSRSDVVVVDVNLLRRSWYFDYLRREYPKLLADSHDEVDAFLQDLRQWEQDPEAYARDPLLNRRIDTRFNAMILAFVRRHLASAPVYLTQDVALNPETRNGDLAKALFANYQFVPQGLVFQLFSDRAEHELAETQLRMRGLADGTLRFDVDDVVTLKVLPVYVSMAYNRGRYLGAHGHPHRAVESFKEALRLDPAFPPAQRALADALRSVP